MLSLTSAELSSLEQALKERISGEVRFDAGSRALYAADASNYRQVPIGVVIPRTKKDIVEAVAICHKLSVPLLSRGGGTSLAGQCCNVALVLDMSKYYNQILSLDPKARTARIQPGLVLDVLRNAALKQGLTFGPDPSTHTHCTLGGMMGNNSCGTHAQMAGKTADNVISMEILTYDGLVMEVGETSEAELKRIIAEGGRKGEIYSALVALRDKYADEVRKRYTKIPRRVSGYNLDSLLPEDNFNLAKALIGSESTLITILEATVKLIPNPKARTLVVLGYKDVYEAADQVPRILKHVPIALEGMDKALVDKMKSKTPHSKADLLPKGGGWLLVEFGADTREESDRKATAMITDLKLVPAVPNSKIYDNKAEEKEVWTIRESGLGATAFVPGEKDTWEGWEDSAVDPAQLGDYLRQLRKLYDDYGYEGALYGHFGQGCIHTRITFDLVTDQGIKKFRKFLDDASDLALKYNGSLSGEHGDGQSRAELLPKMFGPKIIQAFEEYKAIWDPLNKMNPGKVVHAYKILDNLRLGEHYNPWRPQTHFQFPTDQFDFSRSALRCVGVGKCRRDDGEGTMCPSYRVTREEKHSTRGRAHLLFEMLRGEVIKDGWKSEEVKDALDLCLSCKGCKGDCPVKVDIASYKAEFLSHYYEGRLRPRSAYALGLIYWWSRAASITPGLVNFFTQTPGLSDIAKFAAGVSPKRRIPPFARQTFKDWFRKRAPSPACGRGQGEGNSVILWVDTFNNYFHPEIAKAAVEVLEDAGWNVKVPPESLCCGRPLYDYGWLKQAKSMLESILNALRQEIRAGTYMVGLEPSCTAVFRDELCNMLPNDPDAVRLSNQTFMLSEFLINHAQDFKPRPLGRRALVQGHCHHRAAIGFKDEQELMNRLGLDVVMPEQGCCGMAGAFGFEEEHAELSQKCGEQALFPAVKNWPEHDLLIADGFSCREQIFQNSGRLPLHIAQVLRLARDQ